MLPVGASAQKEVRQRVKKGNQLFEKSDYTNAEIEYRKSLELNSKDKDANYNLANTLFKTERGDEASKIYNQLLKDIELLPNNQAADVAHNAGNLAMAVKDYKTAIELYKTSLRKRPTDEETRYNLALAQKLLKQQEQNNGENEDNENKENEQEQENQNENKQQSQEDQQQNQPEKNKPQQQPSQEQQMSQDNAEKILDAYLQEEKDTQRKVELMKQQQQKGKKSRPKNW